MQEKCDGNNAVGHEKLQTLESIALSVPHDLIYNQNRKNDCREFESIENQTHRVSENDTSENQHGRNEHSNLGCRPDRDLKGQIHFVF
jgi:hypothetical protein